jgi:hypothetical protein
LTAEGGIYKSTVFPGLWLDVPALLGHDAEKLYSALDQGMATPEYAAFAAQVKAAKPPTGPG